MSLREGKPERVWSLIGELRVPMVVTRDRTSGHLRARPMAAHPAPLENAIFFLTDVHAAKDDEIERDSNVCLVFSDAKAQKYLSLTGLAHLSDDRRKIEQLWSSIDAAFWKDANDPSIRLLTFVPTEAEYWESAGVLASYVEMVKAAIAGGQPELRSNEKVKLS